MASNPNHRGTDAYYLSFMAGELHEADTVKVMMDPKFWDFLALKTPKHVREWLADKIVRRTMDEDTMDPERVRVNKKVLEGAKAFLSGDKRLQECDEKFQAFFTDISEGGGFEVLRDWFCSMDEEEDEREAMRVEEKVEKENEKSEAEDGTTWEWSESDAEAEEWLFERDALTARGMAGWPEVRRGWEWTEYDSEAEREEAKRQLL